MSIYRTSEFVEETTDQHDVSQMGCQEGVNSPWGPHEVRLHIKHRSSQGPCNIIQNYINKVIRYRIYHCIQENLKLYSVTSRFGLHDPLVAYMYKDVLWKIIIYCFCGSSHKAISSWIYNLRFGFVIKS